jgi:signal transduction histidine kinase
LRHAEHRVVVTVTADAAPPGVGGRVVVAVQDDGPGLTGTAAGDAFGRGARGPGSAAGHGIGLALVREVVERHEGTVRVDPAPDGGARFVLELPAQG